MANREVNLTKRVQTLSGWRYSPVALSANGRVKPDVVLVNGKEERHPEGAYYLEWREGSKRVRVSVGKNAQDAAAPAALLKHGKGIEIGAFGTKLDTSTINEDLYNANLRLANQATRDYVTAMGAAHEAITQLPRLQTFGKSNRMTEQQMEAAQNMLPHPGDDAGMAQQKMQALQTTIDPLRKQVPHMPGAEQIPSWLEQRQQRQTPSGGSKLGQIMTGGQSVR